MSICQSDNGSMISEDDDECAIILKVHKRENFLGSDIEICTFS